jgi:hypothetical protein
MATIPVDPAAVAKLPRGVGIGSSVFHVPVMGSKASTTLVSWKDVSYPPIA